METNIRTNIGGFIFNLESSAFAMLENYLDKIKASFSSPEEAEEISNDIEYRIAELLREQEKDEDTIVELKNIQAIIEILGYPDDEAIDMSDHEDDSEIKGERKLYRHPSDRYLGGISGGFGAYFGVHPNIFRVLFIILGFFSGFGALLYLVLWAIIPEARTRIHLLQLKGKNPSFDNLEDAIEEEFSAVKNSFNTLKNSKGLKQLPKFINKVLKAILNIFIFVFKTFAFFIAIIALFISTAMLFAFVTSLFFPGSIFSPIGWFNAPIDNNFYQLIFPLGDIMMLKLGLLLFLGIPALFVLMGSIRILFRLPFKNRKIIRATGLVAWIIGLFMIASIGLSQRKAFAFEAEESKEYILKAFESDTLYVESNELDIETLHLIDGEFQLDDATWRIDNDKTELVGHTRVYFKIAENNQFKVKTEYEAAGESNKTARAAAKNIIYEWQQKDSVLSLTDFFQLSDKSKKWKNQRARIYIYVPEGKYVKLSKSMNNMSTYGISRYYRHRKNNAWRNSNENTIWLAQNDEFVVLGEKQIEKSIREIETIIAEEDKLIDSIRTVADSMATVVDSLATAEDMMLQEMKKEIQK